MENATKALLIAAAVLIVILLISLVMGVFNRGAEFVESAGDLSEYEVQQFNSKFTKFEGENKSGSEVNSLIKTVFNHNLAQEEGTARVRVDLITDQTKTIIGGGDTSFDGTKSPEQVSAGKRYDVKCYFHTTTKLIWKIEITEK